MSTIRHAEVLLVLGQHRVAGGARVQHQLFHLEPAAAHALDDVLGGAAGAGDDVHLHLEAAAAHADRLLDLVAVDHELLRLHQQQALVVGDVDGLGGLDHARTSTGVTSLSRTITMPVEFWPRMWLPVMPV